MTGEEMREKRRALGMTQAEFAERLGLNRDFIGLMERGTKPITARTATAVLHLTPPPLDRKPTLSDPLERMIEQALIDAGVKYLSDQGGAVDSRLDFHLVDLDIFIEVKRFHTHRVADQIAREKNVILAQGEVAVQALAAMIRAGGLSNHRGD